ncbi:MAG: LamG domain-containing protein [Methanoregula sp.]|nr:LamG domain-containing protein [Methanoregula sp.]
MIIFLIILLASVAYIIFGGSIPFLQKTSLVAASAGVAYIPIDAKTTIPVFDVLPRAGKEFFLTGQQNIPGGAPSVSFLLVGPDGSNMKTSLADVSGTGNLYGKSLYLYRDMRGGGYWVTDSMQTNYKPNYLLPLRGGDWIIKMIDDTANVPLNEMTVFITGNGSIANPLAPKTIWTNTTNITLTNSSGYQIPFTNNGVIPFTGPNGLKAFQFNGSGAYIQGANNPDLSYTGDLSLSLWLQPTPAGVNGYHQLVGKGAQSDTNENYDMFIINQRLYLELTDRNTNQVYHIMTNTAMTWGSPPSWNYVTMTINSGSPTVYFAGNPVPVGFYQSNVPGNNPIASVSMNLKDNNNPITIGKQNYPGAEFFYAGNISEVSFYNRALSPSEITANKNNYQT